MATSIVAQDAVGSGISLRAPAIAGVGAVTLNSASRTIRWTFWASCTALQAPGGTSSRCKPVGVVSFGSGRPQASAEPGRLADPRVPLPRDDCLRRTWCPTSRDVGGEGGLLVRTDGSGPTRNG